MARFGGHNSPRRNTYGEFTHRPVNCLAFIAIPLACFEFGTVIYGTDLRAPHDMDRLLQFFGVTRAYLPALLIVAILLGMQVARKENWQVQPRVLAGMLGESVLWMIPLIGIDVITRKLLTLAAQTGGWSARDELIQKILLATGAGIYEEFVFRLLLVGLLMILLVDVFGLPWDWMVSVSVLVTGVLFSLYHIPSEKYAWAAFPWYQFVFRTLAGVYLGGVYIYRGFGIAVGVHIFFNVFAASGAMGS